MDKLQKQQLKEAAKNRTCTMGVIAFKNNRDNKWYIEGSLNLEASVNRIQFLLNIGQFPNLSLQQDWNTHGETAFSFDTLLVIEKKETIHTNYRQEVMKAEKAAKEKYQSQVMLY